MCLCSVARETKEGWPLLTVETELNGDSKRTNKGLSWLVCWTCRADTRDFCIGLAALVGPVQNIFFLTIHFFYSFVPISQQAGNGKQPCWVARLLVCVYDHSHAGWGLHEFGGEDIEDKPGNQGYCRRYMT